MIRMLILDRDGVINEDSDDYIKSADEWIPIDGSIEAVYRLKKAGYLVTVASNQAGLARGLFDEQALQGMHDKMNRLLAQRGISVDGIYFCPHGPNDNCACRKPKPGLLLQIVRAFNIRPDEALFVGDKMTDIQAARMAGIKPVLVKTGKGLRTIETYGDGIDATVYDNLSHFVREFLKKHNDEQ